MTRRIKSNVKFSGVDVLAFMGEVVQKHTKNITSLTLRLTRRYYTGRQTVRNGRTRHLYGYAGRQEHGVYMSVMYS